MTRESAAPAEGLRERHRKRTAADLEEAALELFSERGFDAVTIDDIAAAADVSRRTFFRYFASKEDVILSDHPKRLDELQVALDRRPADEPALTALRHAIMSLAGTYEEEREHMLRRFRLMTTTPALEARSLCLQRNWETAVTDMLSGGWESTPPRICGRASWPPPRWRRCGWPRPTGWRPTGRATAGHRRPRPRPSRRRAAGRGRSPAARRRAGDRPGAPARPRPLRGRSG